MTTLTLRPTGAGALTEWTSQYPASGAHWEKVDESVADDDTTYIYSQGTPTDLFSITPSVLGGKINSVAVTVRVYPEGYNAGEDAHAWGAVRTHDTTYYSSASQNFTYHTYTNLTFTWTTNPNTSSAWTWSEIYTMQIGLKTQINSTVPTVRCTQVYATVDYTVETVKSNFAMGDCGVF